MNIEFDTNQTGMNGWFSGFCPSNGIADRLNKKAASIRAEKAEWDKKYSALENGQQASEWADLKAEVARTEKVIQDEKRNLEQENAIADALGINKGLGAWCNGAVAKRKKAEVALQDAENALGKVKGAYETLERQQKEGITRASEVIENNNKTIESLKQQVDAVKQKIAVYKAKRDAEKAVQEQQLKASVEQPKKINTAGFISKENAPLLIAGVAVAAAIVYVNRNKKKNNVKKVTA